jgi:hypothetical protein
VGQAPTVEDCTRLDEVAWELRSAMNLSSGFDDVMASVSVAADDLADTVVGPLLDRLATSLQTVAAAQAEGDDPFAALMEIKIASASIAIECHAVDSSLRTFAGM